MLREKCLGAAAALLLAGCAAAPRFHAGQALIKGETPVFPPAPDSLRCELELTAFGGGRKSSVSASLSARPASAYKLDLFGLPGMVAGSFLWTPSRWNLVLFDREEYGEGAGEHVEIGNLGLQEVSVHDVFSFLWGDFFPGALRSGDTARGASGASDPKRRQRNRPNRQTAVHRRPGGNGRDRRRRIPVSGTGRALAHLHRSQDRPGARGRAGGLGLPHRVRGL